MLQRLDGAINCYNLPREHCDKQEFCWSMSSVVDNRIHLASLGIKGFLREKRQVAESSGSETNTI